VVKIEIGLEIMGKKNERIILILEVLILGKSPCKRPNFWVVTQNPDLSVRPGYACFNLLLIRCTAQLSCSR